ncbi:PRD domain-containing protein [Clostridium niameyense]|uniref:PRD domain-containing protein n=1 Tax=Clostridium niameyense TaxID=1622073 RepID=A0A6M0R7V7_9CLOT|nr:PRD domain-containing protein [Clostridium niameyense]NEZ45847.1 PRD domain-containing protein [Clostridium niameyense]
MDSYKVKRILNNNVIIVEYKNEELILVGKGIGFNSRAGEPLSKEKIENVYIKKTSNITENYNKVLNKIDEKIVGISEEIINIAENKLNAKLNEGVHISLPDHINFAIRRIEKGINIENPFLEELRILYPNEYEISLKGLDIINKRLNVNLPKDEAGFICLHIRGGITRQDVSKSLEYTKKISKVMELINKLTGRNINKDSLSYVRTLTHINFMVERVKENKTIKNQLLDSIKKELSNEFSIAIKVAMLIEKLFKIKVPEDEIGYIALHLKRLC